MPTINSQHNALVSLTPRLKEVLIGHLLGDGCLSYCGKQKLKSPRFVFSQTKYDAVCELANEFKRAGFLLNIRKTPPRVYTGAYGIRNNKEKWSIQIGSPAFSGLYKMFYGNRKQVKTPPKNLDLTYLMLAKWFEDDGSGQNRTGVIHTESFSKTAVIRLIKKINSLSKYKSASLRKTKFGYGWNIYLVANSPVWTELSPYIQSCFKYKLPSRTKGKVGA